MSNKKIILAQQKISQGNFLEAEKICKEELTKEKNPSLYNLLGIIELKKKHYTQSNKYFNKFLKLEPNNVKVLNNLGVLLIETKKYDEAIKIFNDALQKDKNFTTTYLNLAETYQRKNNLEKTLTYLNQALKIDSKNSIALNNIANIYMNQKKYEQALSYYKKSLQHNFSNELVHNNVGLAYERFSKFKKAIFHYKESLKINPLFYDCQFNLSILYFKTGQCKKGIQLYDSRFLKTEKILADFHKIDNYLLNYAKISKEKKIYVISEQGYGDVFQFIRLGLELKKINSDFVFVIQDELYDFVSRQEIFKYYLKTSKFLKENNSPNIIPLLSIPKVFDIEFNTILNKENYLKSDAVKNKYWRKKISQNNFNIGISWKTDKNDKNVPLNLFKSLTKIKNVNLISLHLFNYAEKDLSKVNFAKKITSFKELDKDYRFCDTAAIIHNLDLIISIDTSLAHLSASMGKPTWILLPFYSDWRWLTNSNNSIWYKKVKLFRSKSNENWQDVMDKVEKELIQLIKK